MVVLKVASLDFVTVALMVEKMVVRKAEQMVVLKVV
jgi:hypothetical protein